MCEIRIVGPGKTSEYPYPVCKKLVFLYYIEHTLCFLLLYDPIMARVTKLTRLLPGMYINFTGTCTGQWTFERKNQRVIVDI